MNPAAPAESALLVNALAGIPAAWHRRALCRHLPVAVFYPAKDESAEPAKSVCVRCPARADCLEHALTAPEPYGVWGGTDERERRDLRRARRVEIQDPLVEAG